MAHADAQAPESVTLRGDDVAQAIVAAVAARFLEPHRAAGKIDLVMRHQHLRRCELVETQHAGYGSAAAVHEAHGLHQPDILAADSHAREFRLVLALGAEGAAMPARQLVHQPEAGVVARACVFGPGIAQPDNDLEWMAWHDAETKTPLQMKRR